MPARRLANSRKITILNSGRGWFEYGRQNTDYKDTADHKCEDGKSVAPSLLIITFITCKIIGKYR